MKSIVKFLGDNLLVLPVLTMFILTSAGIVKFAMGNVDVRGNVIETGSQFTLPPTIGPLWENFPTASEVKEAGTGNVAPPGPFISH